MHYHLILTETCNSKCRYCYEKSLKEFDNELGKKFKFDFSTPESSEINIKKLRNFLSKDKNPVLIFYGGEPLLEIEKIEKIIDSLKDRGIKFRMQTNGKLLDKINPLYLNSIGKLLVSLDGDKERTDYNKGEGTYDLVMNNLEKIRQNRFQGEIIARMTISEFPDTKEIFTNSDFRGAQKSDNKNFSDIYNQVLHLINEGFTSIHWQLDAGFFKFDYDEKKFSKFVQEYNKQISKLIDFWIKDMKKNHRVLKIYPFLGIMHDIIHDNKTKLRCGAGYEGYAIDTRGKIITCPTMSCITDFEAGDLDCEPKELKKFEISECKDCDYLDLCGGRCLYWRKANLWPESGNKLICKTIKHLIDKLKSKHPVVQELIQNKTVKLRDFDYEKYFGPEIIP
ncbi:MAG: radical SAM protein [Nanoarchaeota archaeon]